MGAAAGLWAGFVAQGALLLAEWTGPMWLSTYLPVWALGTVFGLLFAPTGEFLNRHFRRAARTLVYAAPALRLLGHMLLAVAVRR